MVAGKSYWATAENYQGMKHKSYWADFDDANSSVFPLGPNEPIFDNPVFGRHPQFFRTGRILLPFDIWGWFTDGLDAVFHPKKYEEDRLANMRRNSPPPSQPTPPGSGLLRYHLRSAYSQN